MVTPPAMTVAGWSVVLTASSRSPPPNAFTVEGAGETTRGWGAASHCASDGHSLASSVASPPPGFLVSVHRHASGHPVPSPCGCHSRAAALPALAICARASATTAALWASLQPAAARGTTYHSDHHTGRLLRERSHEVRSASFWVAVNSSVASSPSRLGVPASTLRKSAPWRCPSQ